MTNRKELFEKTLTTLIEAWERGELEHGECERCAVGNICGGSEWRFAFSTREAGTRQTMHYKGNGFSRKLSDIYAMPEILATGYTAEELARIEWAFESSIAHDYHNLSYTSEGQYIGLCAVIDVLTDIHGIEAPGQKTDLNRVATTKGVTALQPA